MFFVLSPAKNLNEKAPAPFKEFTQPDLLAEAEILMRQLRELAPQQIAELMHVSDKIALLNAERNAEWHTPFTLDNAKQAVFMFNGDVYEGIAADTLKPEQIQYLQQHVRLLSGLYGVLRPLDLMQPYRLEMGTAFANTRGKNLYEFWGDTITNLLNDTLTQAGSDTLVNLASQEYFKSVNTKNSPINNLSGIHPHGERFLPNRPIMIRGRNHQIVNIFQGNFFFANDRKFTYPGVRIFVHPPRTNDFPFSYFCLIVRP